MLRAERSDQSSKQSEREIAYLTASSQQCFSERRPFSRLLSVVGTSILCPATFSLYRYPSPDRSAYSPSRPITEIRLLDAERTDDIGYHGEFAIHLRAGRANCGAADITTIGLRLCKRHQSSLRQWQYLVWQVALTTMQSVALPARRVALWPQKFLAQTAQAPCLQALRSACCATTQALPPAAKLDNSARFGRAINGDRRRGYAPAAVFAFLGT